MGRIEALWNLKWKCRKKKKQKKKNNKEIIRIQEKCVDGNWLNAGLSKKKKNDVNEEQTNNNPKADNEKEINVGMK